MAVLTIRNLDEALKIRLRVQAAEQGHSMEEEARRILRQALSPPKSKCGLGTRLHRRFVERTGGTELELPERTPPRDPPSFASEE